MPDTLTMEGATPARSAPSIASDVTMAAVLARLESIEAKQAVIAEACTFLVGQITHAVEMLTALSPLAQQFADSPIGRLVAGRIRKGN